MTRRVLTIQEFINHPEDVEIGDIAVSLMSSSAELVSKDATDIDSLLEGGTIRHIISDETLDRHGDIVSIKGWNFDDYLKNPVILWAHSHYQPVIGKCVDLAIKTVNKAKRIVAVGDYPSAAIYEFGNTVFRLVAGGYMNATSVGFMPTKYELMDDEDPWGGVKILEKDLWEYSVVPIPANPNALQLAAKEMTGYNVVERWAEEVLDSRAPATHLSIEKAYNILKGAMKSFTVPNIKPAVDERPDETQEFGEHLETDAKPETTVGNITVPVTISVGDPEFKPFDAPGGNLLGATADHDEEIAIRIIERDDPVILRIVDEPTLTVDESDIKKHVASAVCRITGRLID